MAHVPPDQPDIPPRSPVSATGAPRPDHPEVSERTRAVARGGLRDWFLKPQIQVYLSVVLVVISQVCLKLGATDAVSESWIDISQLRSGWVWVGIGAMIASLLSWLHALRSIELSIAYNLSGMLHVLVPLSSWLVLGEAISIRQWLGIALVVAGVVITSESAEKTLGEQQS